MLLPKYRIVRKIRLLVANGANYVLDLKDKTAHSSHTLARQTYEE